MMNSYYILTKNEEDPIILQDGFNFYCLFFGLFWALYKGVWSLSAIFISLFIVSTYIKYTNIIDPIYIESLTVIANLMIAFHANDSVKQSLINNGYTLSTIIASDKHELAYQRYLDHIH